MTGRHIAEERLFEIACGGAVPVNGEAAHLASCGECSARLARERELTAMLEALSPAPPEGAFVAAATARFESAIRIQARRRALVLVGVLLAGIGLWLALALSASAALTAELGAAAARISAIVRAASALSEAVPAVSAIAVAAAALVIIAACGGLAALVADGSGRPRKGAVAEK